MTTPRLPDVISKATRVALRLREEDDLPAFDATTTLGRVEEVLEERGLKVGRLLAEAALEAFREESPNGSRTDRKALRFLISDKRPTGELCFTANSRVNWSLDPKLVRNAVIEANRTIELIHDLAASNEAPVFDLLGLRNLSSFVGEIFAGAMRSLNEDYLLRNPNQDGHPDLMALTPEGQKYIQERTRNGQIDRDKRHWSPYPFGGIEVKATCGNTPDAKKMPKPQIGEQRCAILVSAEWKAHHRETNNLLALFWDFVDGLPTILAAFFRNDLTPEDWGEVVRPGEGSRTTSVSIMTRTGVKRMGEGWVVLPKHPQFLQPIAQLRVFNITSELVRRNCSDTDAVRLLG